MKNQKDVPKRAKILRFLFLFTAVVYALSLLRLSLFKYVSLPELLFSPDRYFSRSVQLIPFADAVHSRRLLIQCAENAILYFPLGFLLSMQTAGKRKRGLYLLIPLIVSLIIEALQYALAIGALDTADIVMNTLGGAVGFFAYDVLLLIFRKHQEKLDTVLTICMALVGAVCLFFYLIGTNWSAYKQFF